MKLPIQLAALVLTVCLVGCASNSVKETWKSPAYQAGPVQKVAVIAVDERGLVRQGIENRYVRDLKARGQQAIGIMNKTDQLFEGKFAGKIVDVAELI